MAKGRKILLLDGTGLVYRAYFAFITRPLTTSRGENTSAIFGFLRILIQIIRDFNPDTIITAFDMSRKTFRSEIFAEYKAQREETPPDLKSQIPVVIEMLNLMHLPVLEMEGYEADDIIGSLSEQLKKDNEVYIVSSDKDLLQLVDDSVKAIRPQKGVSEIHLVDKAGVKETLGVESSQVADYLAIVGDTSDNIPGVKGIGEKGAAQLLSQYKSLEDIYEHIDDIKGAMQKKLIDSKDNAFMSKRLAQIKLDLDIHENVLAHKLDIPALLNPEVMKKLEHYQITSVAQELRKLSLKQESVSTAVGLFAEEPVPVSSAGEFSGEYHLISSRKELEALIKKIRDKKFLSLDTETTSTSTVDAGLIGVSIAVEEGEAYFIPALYDTPKDFDEKTALELLRPILEDDQIKKIGQNTKFEYEIFRMRGVQMRGIVFDTMIAAYLINPVRARNNLEALVQEYLGFRKKDYKEVMKSIVKKDKTLLDAPVEDITNYACADADATLRLKNKLEALIEENGLTEVFYNIELPLIPPLAEMELAGVEIDIKRLSSLSKELEAEIVKLEERIYHHAGHIFNINSPAQLGRVLFEELKLEPVKKTDSGKPSTDEEVLTALALVHPLPSDLLQYRTYTKLKGTYIDTLPQMVSARTGRIHTNYNQTIAATGRLSSVDPNLQNIPVRDELGQKIREAFVAKEGCVLISADYSQIELRVLAHFCGDEAMKKAFTNKIDIHTHTASLIFNVPEKEVTDEMRRRAKSVNFGIIYGLQAYGLSRQLGIPMGEAKEFIASYFTSFPKVKALIESILLSVSKTGEVRTLSGRYRRFPELVGKEIKNTDYLGSSQRMAVNTRMQGSAADIIKAAMIKLAAAFIEKGLKSRMILQIHDELVVEAPVDEVEKVTKMMKEIMESAWELTIPMVVEIGSGMNWREAH